MDVHVHNASKTSRSILTNDNVAGFILDNTYYEGDQAKTLQPRANEDGYADLTTSVGSQRPERHFPVKNGATIDVY